MHDLFPFSRFLVFAFFIFSRFKLFSSHLIVYSLVSDSLVLGALRATMGPCWDQLGSSWGHLGVILGLPGAVWAHLGAILGLSCGHAILAPTWRHLGLSSSLLPSSFMHSCPPTLRYACFRQSIRFPQSTLHTSSWLSLMQDTGRWKLRLTELTHCFDSVR